MTEAAPEDAPPTAEEDEPASPSETLRKGGPKVFLALTCGFLALLCCLGGCVGGGALGFVRTGNLEDARVGLGAPEGWTVGEEDAWPWGASAALTGPADPLAFGNWLSGLGAEYDPATVAACLAADDPCELTFKAGERTVKVTYSGGGEGRAEVTVT